MASAVTSNKPKFLPGSNEIETRKQKQAYASVYEQLAQIVEPFGPLNRQEGVNMYKGVDIVNQRSESHALTPIGVLLIAVEKLGRWEAGLHASKPGNMGKQTIERPDSQQLIFFQESDQILGALLHDSGGLSSEDANGTSVQGLTNTISSSHDSGDTRVLVSLSYLERIERENELFRCHLQRFEIGVAKRLEKVIEEALAGWVSRPKHPTPSVSRQTTLSTERKRMRRPVGLRTDTPTRMNKANITHSCIRKRGVKGQKASIL
ncbi:hypothetical protein MMC14_009433 [Varicellaria rhodocarpa]|nr:hypothetical protein [Varicellaria rhodocarpa]